MTSTPSAWRFNRKTVLIVLGVALGLFHLYTAFFGLLPATTQRGIHWGMLGIMAFLAHPLGKWQGSGRGLKIACDMLLILLFVGATGYLLMT